MAERELRFLTYLHSHCVPHIIPLLDTYTMSCGDRVLVFPKFNNLSEKQSWIQMKKIIFQLLMVSFVCLLEFITL
jgi:hypothetical protein